LAVFPSAGLKNGSVIHRDKLMDAIEAAVKDAELMSGHKVDRAVVSISGENIRSINTQGAIAIQKNQHSSLPVENEITEHDVFRVMEMARALSLPSDRDIMHVLPQEYVIDTMDNIKDPVGMSGRRLGSKSSFDYSSQFGGKKPGELHRGIGNSGGWTSISGFGIMSHDIG
jgi:cell division protein FtsA